MEVDRLELPFSLWLVFFLLNQTPIFSNPTRSFKVLLDCIQRNNLRVSLIGFEPTLFEYSKVYSPEYYQDIGVPSRIQTYEFTQWEQIYSLPASFILHTDT